MSDESMTAPDDERSGAVAESFLDQFRRGERPALVELMARHPELAGPIGALFPAQVELERHGEIPDGSKPPPVARSHYSDAHGEGPWPERLGDYLIIRRIGGGGMGVVYEAEHESLKSRVALKVVHPQFRADPKYLRRFHAEARVAAGLHHTNIVSVFDYGDHDGVCYYAMQYIQGQPLDQLLAGIRRLRDRGTRANISFGAEAIAANQAGARPVGPSLAIEGLLNGRFAAADSTARALARTEPIERSNSAPSHRARTAANGAGPPGPVANEPLSNGSSTLSDLSDLRYFREIARVGAQVADALEYAHRRGVLHRDIKPSNLLLDALGNVWVTDFGLAKLEEGDDLSHSRELVGTLRYMAPERFRGISDRRGDLYSLGATLYELLTLRPPFEGLDQIRLIELIRSEQPAPPRHLGQNIPRDLETIVMKSLGKDPKDRFGSAGELAEELRRFVEGRPIRSRPVSFVERFWRWCRRDPWLAGANIAAAVLLIMLTIVSSGAAVVSWRQAQAISVERGRSDAAALDARWRAVDAYTAQARAGKFSHRPGQRFDSLEAVSQAMRLLAGLPEGPETATRRETLRDLAIACMALPDLKPTGRVIDRPMDTLTTAFDLKMTRYAHYYLDGRVSVKSLGDDHEIAAFKTPADRELWMFSFSPDGRYLAASRSRSNGLTVWNVDQHRTVLTVPGAVGYAGKFSPDSGRFVLRRDGEVLDFDLAAGRPVRRWPGQLGCLAFRPDGSQVALIDNNSQPPSCRIIDWRTGGLVRTFPLRYRAENVAWSPDGTTLAVASYDHKIDLWDVPTSSRRGILDGHFAGGLNLDFHPAGNILASNDYMGLLRIWDPILGRPILDMAGAGRVQYSESGQVVVERLDQLSAHQTDPAVEYRTFAFGSGERGYYCASVRHDGRLLAVGTEKGVVLCDMAKGTELAYLPIGTSLHMTFDRSGDLITSGSIGVWRLPIHLDADRGRLEIGHPKKLALPQGNGAISTDASAITVAKANFNRAYVANSAGSRPVGPLNDCRSVAVSPDGQWLATGTHTASQGAQVWRISDLSRVADLPIIHNTAVMFSPDGKWLATTSPTQLWEVGTWQKARRIGDETGCFSPDGRLMAVQGSSRLIRLVETETGSTLARLESPDLCRGRPAFSPDGSRLVLVSYDGSAVHVWDLRAIRRHLAGMSLDWDAPAYSDQDPAAPTAPPIRHVEIRDFFLATARGGGLAASGRWEEAAAAFEQAFACGKSDRPDTSLERAILNLAVGDVAAYRSTRQRMLDVFNGNNDLAWLVFAAHAFVLDTAGRAESLQTLRLAERRAKESPDVFSEHVMGMALYRAGRYAEAEAREVANIAHHPGWRCEVLDRLVVAMAQQRLGRGEEARRTLEQAERWIAEQVRDRPGGPDRAVPDGWHWRDAIMMHMLLREARTLMFTRVAEPTPGRFGQRDGPGTGRRGL